MKYTQEQLDKLIDACDETAETIHKNFPEMDAIVEMSEHIEEALILGTGGFNACPMEQFDRGEASLERAIELCFDQTFSDVLSEEFQVGAAKEPPEEPGMKLVKN